MRRWKASVVVMVGLTALACSVGEQNGAAATEDTQAVQDSGPCGQLVDAMFKQIKAVVHDPSATPTAKATIVNQIFKAAYDPDRIAYNAAGDYWGKASAEERAAYLKTYREYFNDPRVGPVAVNGGDMNVINDIAVSGFRLVESTYYELDIAVVRNDGLPRTKIYYMVEYPPGVCHMWDVRTGERGEDVSASEHGLIQRLGAKGGLPAVTQTLSEWLKDGRKGSAVTAK
jgi:hypothetical protein